MPEKKINIQCCQHSNAFMFDWKFIIFHNYENDHNKILNKFKTRPDYIYLLIPQLVVLECLKYQYLETLKPLQFDRIFFILAVT